jgi:hypothetical protein
MGIGGPATSVLSILHRHKALDGMTSVVEIGAQDLNKYHISFALDFPHTVPRTTRKLRNGEEIVAKNMLPKDMYKNIGITRYVSIDINGHNDALAFDMNLDLVKDYEFNEKFHMVTNFGTTEHICNQANVFKNMHEMCLANGLMIGIVPFQGALNHGFFNYQPLFFEQIALANNYELNLYWTIASPQFYTQNVLPYDQELINCVRESVKRRHFRYLPYEMEEELCYVFRKTVAEPFIQPDQAYLGQGGNRLEMKKIIHPVIRDIDYDKDVKKQLFFEYLSLYGHGHWRIYLFKLRLLIKNNQYHLIIPKIYKMKGKILKKLFAK